MNQIMKLRTFCIVSMCFFLPVLQAWAVDKPMGRLFLTASERARLDRLRQHVKLSDEVKEGGDQLIKETVDEPKPIQWTVDGFVRRSSGKDVTWINQVPQYEQQRNQNMQVKQLRLKPPLISLSLSNGQKIELKVGQTFDSENRKVRDVYEKPSLKSVDLSKNNEKLN